MACCLIFCTSFLKTPNSIEQLQSILWTPSFQATLRHRPDMVRTLQYTPVVISNKLSKLGLLGFHLRMEKTWVSEFFQSHLLFYMFPSFRGPHFWTPSSDFGAFFPDVWATHACDATSLSAIGPSSTIRSERKGHEVLDEGHDASGNSRSRLFLASHLLRECQASWELN